MKKIRLFVWIISLILACLCLSASICFPTYYLSCMIAIIILLFLNFSLKRKEINEIRNIIIEYFNDCDVNKYINKLDNFKRRCFFTKNQKKFFNLYNVTAYIDKGEFEKAKEILLDIDTTVKNINSLSQFIYLKNWCDYFFHKRLDEKMKYTLVKMSNIINANKNKRIKMQLIQMFQNTSAKYEILINGSIPEVKNYIYARKQFETTLYQKLNTNYLLALIDLRTNNVPEAMIKLRELSEYNKDLYICKEAKSILTKIESASK